jgi:hypothetical protein
MSALTASVPPTLMSATPLAEANSAVIAFAAFVLALSSPSTYIVINADRPSSPRSPAA